MMAEAFAPVVQPTECGRESERGLSDPFGRSYLQVQRDSLEMVVVGLDLSAQITCHSRETEVNILVEVVET